MPYTEEHLRTAQMNVAESEKRVSRLSDVVAHLKQHGQSTASAEAQLSQFHAMARAYRERREELEAILKQRKAR